MIIIYHQHNKANEVFDFRSRQHLAFSSGNLAELLSEIALANKDRFVVWCDSELKDQLNIEQLPQIFSSEGIMATFCPGAPVISREIGYVEQSAFVKVNRNVRFATWRMSSAVGGMHAKAILALAGVSKDANFDYYLNSIAKLALPIGLLCYSDPRFLLEVPSLSQKSCNNNTLFRFVKQHYRISWLFLLLLNMLLYEKRFPLPAFLLSLFFRRRTISSDCLYDLQTSENNPHLRLGTLDVIIPTIGRKPYLLDVLNDLAAQTILPSNVIIVEQNPQPGSASELDYLKNTWPFKIRHHFTNQPGACNARNIALAEIESEWVFFADDDIRFESNFIEETFAKISKFRNQVFNICCLQKGQLPPFSHVHQTAIFATGCSFASSNALTGLKFDMAYEFGFGEDSDFGMQLKNRGYDILYLPKPMILHLKAPVGGFRIKPKLAWQNDEIKPKPSPTVMFFKLRHDTREQLLGYKTLLGIKFYFRQPIKNPLRYLKFFRKAWRRSVFWAQKR